MAKHNGEEGNTPPSPSSFPFNGRKHASYSAFSSLVAAMCTTAILHPFDLIKTRNQVSNVSGNAIPNYRTTSTAVRSIFKVEGIGGLYKGLAATLVASGVSWGIFRYLFETARHSSLIKSAFMYNADGDASSIPMSANLIAGMTASLLATSMVHPLWFIKTRLELQSYESKESGWMQYRGWFHCVKSVYKQEGFIALYRGIWPALLMAPHAAIQLVVYEELKKFTRAADGTITPFIPFIEGSASKFIATAITYPLQVLRSRQQMINSPYINHNMLSIAQEIVVSEGIKGLYRGFATHLQRAVLHSGLLFLFFESLYQRM